MFLKKGFIKYLCFVLSSIMTVSMMTTVNLWAVTEDTMAIIVEASPSTKVPVDENGLDSQKRMVSYFGSPIIDGDIDDVWNNAQEVKPQCITGSVYASATFKSLWDDNALYVLAEVKDEYLSVQSSNLYMQDSVEIFLDEKNDKTVDYNVDDLHFRVNYENSPSSDIGDIERFYTGAKKTADGYLIEARIALKDKPSNGKVLGLDLQINDGLGPDRVGTINVFDSTGNGWRDTSVFGEVLLTGKINGAVSGLNPYNLMNLINSAKKIDFTRYINESVVTDAVKKAEEVVAKENVTQKEIDDELEALKAAIGKLILTDEAANEKEFKLVPDEYRADNEQQGTIEKVEYSVTNAVYSEKKDTKYLNVYLPYGYNASDKNKKYNVLYLMHGGGENENLIFGGPGERKELMKILDNMIAKGDIEPLIVVTPSFYGGKNDVAYFYQELTDTVISLVETKYNTYLPSASLQGIKASRDHRAFGGFSMGSVCTWYTFINCIDYIKYFMPLSGDCWALGQKAGDSDSQKTAEYLNSIPKSAGYTAPKDFKVFCATGKMDPAYNNMKPQIDALKQLKDSFIYSSDTTKGNFYFIVSENGTHNWSFINQYIYDILPDVFKDEKLAPVPTSTIVPTSTPTTSTSSVGSQVNNQTYTSTPTAIPTATATSTATTTPTATATPTPVTKTEENKGKPAVGFKDILNHWAKDFINDLIAKNILSGYEDGTIRPDRNISRAELTVTVLKAMGLKPSEKPALDFADKNSIPSWAAGYIALAKEKGIISGFDDKTFKPDKDCSRQEAVTIIMKAFNLGESKNKLKFIDAKDISDWAYKFVAKSTESQIINGYEDNTFKPGKSITRAEIFTVLSKCLKK